jgi:hypothetical protein
LVANAGATTGGRRRESETRRTFDTNQRRLVMIIGSECVDDKFEIEKQTTSV